MVCEGIVTQDGCHCVDGIKVFFAHGHLDVAPQNGIPAYFFLIS